MYDGRDLTLEGQALGAIRAHAQNGFEPTPLQLELIAEFQRSSPRFFSSLPLFLFARGGPPPRLPNGVTASEKRGRAMFDDVPITPGSTRGLCAMCHSGPMLDVSNAFNIFLPDLPGLRFFGVGVTERNKLNLPTHEFIIDGIERIVTPDPGACLTDPPDPNEFPPELFGPGGPLPLSIACSLFKTPSLWGVRHTAPYFHDNSSKTLKEVAEQYTFMFKLFAGISLTPQDEADIVAFLKLL
jgi:cytochrome c peroxidase